MSEYWVSTKRYWCERCKMFVKDSPLSRKDHEASPKHQHALQRFLRDLHKNKEREVVAAENAKREAERLNNLNNPDYVPKPLAKRAADLISKPESSKTNTWRSEEQKKKHMEELAALGVAMPESYRKEHAMVGDWETVRVIERPATPEDKGPATEEESEEKRIKRRKLGEAEDEDEEEVETRNFTLRAMEYPGESASSGGMNDIEFKRKSKTKSGMRTIEYPNLRAAVNLGNISIRKKSVKNEPGEEQPNAQPSEQSLIEREGDGASSTVNLLYTGGDDQLEDPALKQESDAAESTAPTKSESLQEGVAFKARKVRNATRRRV